MNAMNFEQARFNMVEQQVRTWSVLNQDVLDLLFTVRREDFVPLAYRNLAYADSEIPLGHGAVMLAPRIEAHILQALHLRRHERVLEIGAGSGYMAALLAAHASQVWSVEIRPELAQMARDNLQRAGIASVTVETGDGLQGLSVNAPYDAIVISGAVPKIPQILLEQLKVGGRLVAIVGQVPVMEMQRITRVGDTAWSTLNLLETSTAPLANAPRGDVFSF